MSTNSNCILPGTDEGMNTSLKCFHLNTSENKLIRMILVSRLLRAKIIFLIVKNSPLEYLRAKFSHN